VSATAGLAAALKYGLDVDQLAWQLGLNASDREDARDLSLKSGIRLDEAMRMVHQEKTKREMS